MYVTFIPFLLGVILPVDDIKKWTLGPEYVFRLTKITVIHMAPSIAPSIEDLIATVKCQPKLSDVLICCIQNITFQTSSRYKSNVQDVSSEQIDTEQVFEINFSKRGVRNLVIERNSHVGFDIVKWIVEQFNIGIELKIDSEENKTGYENVKTGLYIINSSNENIWTKSKCNTSYLVNYKSQTENHFNTKYDSILKETSHSRVHKNYDYQFIMLPLPYKELTTQTFSIKRRREICSRPPRYLKLRKEVWNIQEVTTYLNTIEVKNKSSRFVSYTNLEGTLVHYRYLKGKFMFTENVRLNLLDVKPASNKFSINNKWIFQKIDEENNKK